MKQFLHDYKTTIAGLLVFVVIILLLMGVITREVAEVAAGILVTAGLIGAADSRPPTNPPTPSAAAHV